jgi:hypothetical protein
MKAIIAGFFLLLISIPALAQQQGTLVLFPLSIPDEVSGARTDR